MPKYYPHQKKLLDKNPARHLIAYGVGTGKTILSLGLAEKNCNTCLIVVPKMLKPMWEREVKKHTDPNTCVYTLKTKEEFKKECETLPAFDGVIVDEAHHFAGEKSQLSKSLLYYFKKHNIKYRWLCTATPYLSTPMNIYMLAKLLGHEINYWNFRKKFFFDMRIGHRMVPKPRSGMEKELAEIVRSIGSVVDLEEAVAMSKQEEHELPELKEVPDQTFETVYFDITDEQKTAIKELDEANFITRWTKTHCIENGILYSDGYTDDQVFESPKTQYIIKQCKKHPKIAVFCRYNKQIERVKEELLDAHIQKPIFILNGDVKNRDEIVQEAEACTQAIVLIQSQCSFGYELPSFPVILFASMSFSYVDYVQSIGRFLRINKMKPNRYVHLVVKGVDQDVYECIMKKQDFSIEIYGRK